MTIYLVHFLLLAIYMLLYSFSPRTKIYRLLFVFLCFVQSFLIYSLRSPFVGTDTREMVAAYMFSYKEMLTNAPLYYCLQTVFHAIVPYGQGYMILCGLLIMGGTAYYLYRNSKNLVMSVFLFFSLYIFFSSMNGARQMIAVVLVTNGMTFLWQNRKMPAMILFLSAFLVHATTIIMLPLLLLLFIKKPVYRHYFFILYCLCLCLYTPFLSIFSSLFPRYGAMYIENDSLLYQVGRNRKALLTLFYAGLFLGSFWTYLKTRLHNTLEENNEWEIFLCCLASAVIIGILALRSILLTRLEIYYIFPMLVFIPLVLSKFKGKSQLILKSGIYLALALPGIVLFVSNDAGVRPYLFFWE